MAAVEDQDSPPDSRGRSAQGPAPAPRPLRILHLEDNPDDRRILAEWLSERNFPARLTAVGTGEDYERKLRTQVYDVILCDKSMPRYDGHAALRFAAALCPNVPFIFVTGSMGEEAAIETIKQGASDYVLKENLSRLIPAIERAVEQAERIAAARQADRKIRAQAALLDKAQDAIVVLDLERAVRYWNHGAERRYGWTADQVYGRDAGRLLFRDSSESLSAAFECVLAKGEWCGEMRQVTREGHEIMVEGRWSLVRDDSGDPECVLAVHTDITTRKALESQLLRSQRLQSIGSLASGIAHDLNNCLSPIVMGVAVLKQMNPEPDAVRILSAMESSAARGAGVVKQVLTFARGTTEKHAAVQVNRIVAEIVRMMRETFPRSITIQSETPRDLWDVAGEPTQIYQVLLNLCINARDAMPNGGTLTLAAGCVELAETASIAGPPAPPGRYVRIDVRDTGTGIPPAIREKIFQPFFTTKEPGKGTGLGLSTTVSIIAKHRGVIGLESTPGMGTTFSIYLPVREAEAEPVGSRELSGFREGARDLILLVDDEAAIREMNKYLLESCNYRVLVAENGAQAIGLFQRYKSELALVVTDSNMPVMGGTTAARVIRWSAPSLKILYTSGAGPTEGMLPVTHPNLQRFLAKPYTAEQLLSAIGELLQAGETAPGHPQPKSPER